MKEAGAWMMAGGIAAALVALVVLPSTVDSGAGLSLSSINGYEQTYNLARAQLREMVLACGGFLFLGGCILFAGGRIAELMMDQRRPSHRIDNSVTEASAQLAPGQPLPHIKTPEEEAAANRNLYAGLAIIVTALFAVFAIAWIVGTPAGT